jgi:pyruvate kinase
MPNDSSMRFDVADEHFRTAIIATVGPASRDAETLGRLVDAGVNIVRLNFSHGDEHEHARTLEVVRAVARDRGVPVAVLGDLPGPKIRLVEVAGDGVDLVEGAEVVFQRECTRITSPEVFGCTMPDMVDWVQPEQRVLINDGQIRLHVVSTHQDAAVCRVDVGGRASSHKGVNLPDTDLDIEMPTPRDREMAAWAVEHQLDWLAMSFVRNAADIEALDVHLMQCSGMKSRPIPIIAKMEVPSAIDHAREIASSVDAMMVARGDLGVELDFAEVPVVQKHLMSICRDADLPCIVATQMLESMIDAPTPTRAEASDVANAVFDGTDAVMLSGETAVGRYPVEAVKVMRRITRTTEAGMRSMKLVSGGDLEMPQARSHSRESAMTHGIWSVAIESNATCIIVRSHTGGWARRLSRNNVLLPVLALADDSRAVRRMLLYRGVTPVYVEELPDGPALWSLAEHEVRSRGWARDGDHVVLVTGTPVQSGDAAASVVVHRLDSVS